MCNILSTKMSKKKDIDFLIQRVKAATGLTQEGIADAINYSRPHFSAMKKNRPDKLYPLLEKHFEGFLQNRLSLEEPEVTYNISSNSTSEKEAVIQVLILEIAKLKSKLYGIAIETAIEELEQNIKIAKAQSMKN